MTKSFVALLVSATWLLAGCGNDDGLEGTPTNNFESYIQDSLAAPTQIGFDLLSTERAVPLPSYLLLDTTTGLLALPDDPAQQVVIDALNHTDGWSITQPIVLDFTGISLDPLAVAGSVYLLETSSLTAGGTPSVLNSLAIEYDPAAIAGGTSSADVFAFAAENTLTIMPLKPLNPSSYYIFGVSNTLLDSDGNAVGMSQTYAHLKSTQQPLPSTALSAAQQLTQATEALLASEGVDPQSLIYTSYFPTLSAGNVLTTAKLLSAQTLATPATTLWANRGVSDADLNALYRFNLSNQISQTPAGNTIYQGTVALPYYLETDYPLYATMPWQADMPSLAKIANVLSDTSSADAQALLGQLANLGLDQTTLTAALGGDATAQQTVLLALFGQTLTLADGSPLDPDRVISRYAPAPRLKSVQNVPFQLISAAACSDTLSHRTTIFQHGIGSMKGVLTAEVIPGQSLADRLIGSDCLAIFAIDLPLHGERTVLDANGSPISAENDTTLYLNLANLTVGRDNLRQSITDVINLRMSIGQIFAAISQGTDPTTLGPLGLLDPTQGVSYLGHSLGGIVGVGVANIANQPTGTDADALFSINKLAAASPGAGIPYLLLNSGNFGNLLKGSLLASDPTFSASCTALGLSDIAECYGAIESNLVAAASDPSSAEYQQLSGFYSVFSAFAFAAQTVLDPVDPINHSVLTPDSVPVYLNQVANDQTIPNSLSFGATLATTDIILPYSPFGGTVPLLAGYGLTPSASSISGAPPLRAAVLFNGGVHSSLFVPSNGDTSITLEMGTELNSYLNGDGGSVDINDASVISLP
uniref:VolA/Pla-1 family phospholipase n=1 Tax=Thaumasiovibrio occultus TaxID=1891184 RepID=UPI000B3579CD|nr:VolA/Pla-1 family phospholipase [Thaumasiovibrio occultus]